MLHRQPLALLLLLVLILAQASAPLPRRGTDRALFIAIDQYDHLDDLTNPIRNVERIAQVLARDYDFDTEILRNPGIDQIDSKLEEYANQYARQAPGFDQEGQLLIFFSGHGQTEAGNGYFLARDSEPDRLTRTAFSYNDGRNIIDRIACKHILVAVDACYSARFDAEWRSRGPEGDDEPPVFGRRGELSQRERLLEDYRSSRTRYFFTSDSQLERTPDKSDFAVKFELALRSDPGEDGMLDNDEFWLTLKQAKPRARKGTFGTIDGIDTYFLFLRNSYRPVSESMAWQQSESRHTVEGYEEFLRLFPNGEFAVLAWERIADLKTEEDQSAWENAIRLDTKPAYQQYLDRFPQGQFRDMARKALYDGDIPEGMVYINGGTYEMGDLFGEGADNEKPVHTVTVSSFYLGANEVTIAEYDEFCDATGRIKTADQNWGRGNLPVIYISWEDAVVYCNWRSEKGELSPVYQINGSNVTADWSANGYRLPTEAEWEYAAREGGKKVRFGNGGEIADPNQMNFNGAGAYDLVFSLAGEYRRITMPVGSFHPNALGIFDMAGNVYEWCWDWYEEGYYRTSPRQDPRGPSLGKSRVIRGGCWSNYPNSCRASFRSSLSINNRNVNGGFRLARNSF